MKFLDHFRLKDEKEDYAVVISNMDKGVVFRGTNLWILVFAIFIASLGLNVNSPAVIIGAMLVSPLMGPIMGMGLGMAINDLALIRKALFNYLLAAGIALVTSTLYFSISPLNEAHSELLARTSPNIYDVLIALFGGLAGILATSSRQKGNVIPGVAIATALMPPLCTAGYGLATLNFSFFFGAFYLFLINTVFIALATLITTRLLKFPYHRLPQPKDELKARRIVWVVVIVTLLPSLYFGYDIVRRNKFQQRANRFIENEAVFSNDYLLKKNIDARKRTITLTYGGQYIEEKEILALQEKLVKYNLDETSLKVQQGFAYLRDNHSGETADRISLALDEKAKQLRILEGRLDSLDDNGKLSGQVFRELKAQYPEVQSCILQKAESVSDSTMSTIWFSAITLSRRLDKKDKQRINQWMKVRVGATNLKLFFEE